MTPGTPVTSDSATAHPEETTDTPERTYRDETVLDTADRHIQRLLDTAGGPPMATTASRAVRPPVVVRNKRLATNGIGESFLVWRCAECGEVGSLDAFPHRCVCGASREALSYVTED